jgi:hypothetical protein
MINNDLSLVIEMKLSQGNEYDEESGLTCINRTLHLKLESKKSWGAKNSPIDQIDISVS